MTDRMLVGALWVSLPAGWLVSTVQVSGTPDLYFYNCIAEKYYNYFNIAKARRERTREAEEARVRVPGGTFAQAGEAEAEEAASNQESTSEREDAVDA